MSVAHSGPPQSSEVEACCLVNRGQGLVLRPSSNFSSGWGADHADLETCALECRSSKKGRYALEADFEASPNGCIPPVADTVLSAQS